MAFIGASTLLFYLNATFSTSVKCHRRDGTLQWTVKMEAIENIVCTETGHCGCHLLALGSELLSPSGEAGGGLKQPHGPFSHSEKEKCGGSASTGIIARGASHLLPHTAPTHPHSRGDPGVRNFPYEVRMRWLNARDKCEVIRYLSENDWKPMQFPGLSWSKLRQFQANLLAHSIAQWQLMPRGAREGRRDPHTLPDCQIESVWCCLVQTMECEVGISIQCAGCSAISIVQPAVFINNHLPDNKTNKHNVKTGIYTP